MSVRRLTRLAGVVAATAVLTVAGGVTVVAASAPAPAEPTVSISLADHGRAAHGNALQHEDAGALEPQIAQFDDARHERAGHGGNDNSGGTAT